MQRSMNAYVKAISKRSEVEGKEKTLPIAYMGGTMISHGEDFESESEYGQSLNSKSQDNRHVLFADSMQCLAGLKKDWRAPKRPILRAPPLAGWKASSDPSCS